MDLALDTSTPRLTLTAGTGSATATFIAPEIRRGNKHLVEGWNTISRALRSSPSDLRTIYLTTGPGSFTGIRIGIAFTQGLSFRNRVRLHPVSTLLTLAMGWPGDGPVLPLLPAGRDLWYAAVYEKKRAWSVKQPPAAMDTLALLRMARAAQAVALPQTWELSLEPHWILEPLSQVLYRNRSRLAPAPGPVRPVYLKSLYD